MMPIAAYGALVGGLTPIKLDASDENVKFAVGAINSYYTQLGDNAQRTLVDVVKAESQVVAGTLYHLVLRVSSGGQSELCEVSVWSRPWLSGDEAMQLSKDPACKAEHQQPLLGGETPADINSDEIQKALTFGVTSMNNMENSMYLRKAVATESVTKQVVSGMMYHFRGVHMAQTSCMKGTTTLLENCAVADDANTRMCDFDVWWQSWSTPEYKLNNFQCK